MEEELPAQYGHGNRAFLQALMSRGTMTFEESRPILAAIFTAENQDEDDVRADQITEEHFQDYLDSASRAVSLFDYEIRSTVHQLSKQRIYAIVNTTSDPQTQLATTFSADELSFLKRLLDAIFDKFNTPRMEVLAVTEMQAIKLARPNRRQSQTQSNGINDDATQGTQSQSTDKGLKHSEVDDMLANLIEGGWMEKSKQGFYSMSPRALLELRPWLTETYNEPDASPDEWQRIKFCEACKELLTIGLRCPEPDCNLRLHEICQDAFWRARRGRTCPRCEREWGEARYVGEKAVTMTEAYQRGRRKSGGRRSTLADDVIQQSVVEEEEEDEEEDEEDHEMGDDGRNGYDEDD